MKRPNAYNVRQDEQIIELDQLCYENQEIQAKIIAGESNDSSSYTSFPSQHYQNLLNHQELCSRSTYLRDITKELEVSVQQIQEQLQLNLLKQTLIIKQQKHNKLDLQTRLEQVNEWKLEKFHKFENSFEESLGKNTQLKIIKQEGNISDDDFCDFDTYANELTPLETGNSHKYKCASNKRGLKQSKAGKEGNKLSDLGSVLAFSIVQPSDVNEQLSNNIASIYCQVSDRREHFLHTTSDRQLRDENSNSTNRISMKNLRGSLLYPSLVEDSKVSIMQLQHQLGIQQQELIQQLQLVQRQYLKHQEQSQEPAAVIIPDFFSAPFEYQSKSNYCFSSMTRIPLNTDDFVPFHDSIKDRQIKEQPQTEQTLKSTERNATSHLLTEPRRPKFSHQTISSSPVSTVSSEGIRPDNTKILEEKILNDCSKYPDNKLEEQFNNNQSEILDAYEQHEADYHTPNLSSSPVVYFCRGSNSINSRIMEGDNTRFTTSTAKCDGNRIQETETPPRESDINGGDINDLDNNDYLSSISVNLDEYINTEKYHNHLFAHGMCRWPGCDLILNDVPTFINLISRITHHAKGFGEELQVVIG